MKLGILSRLEPLPPPPRIEANLSFPERAARLEDHVAWSRESDRRLGRVRGLSRLGILTSAGILGLGVWSSSLVLAGVGVVALVATVVAHAAFGKQKKQVQDYGQKALIASQRAQAGLQQIADQEKARHDELARTVTGLLEAPRTGLAEHQDYLLMPGVRVRKR